MVDRCRKLAGHPAFQNTVVGLILLNAVLLGIETDARVMSRMGGMLHGLNGLFQLLFMAEIAVRIAACWPSPHRFFRGGWNVFDFVVVVAGLLPIDGGFATVGRLLRLLRVTRLVSAFPQLRLIISTMLLSIPSMGHVVLLLGLLLYVYGIAGYYLFHAVDPQRWGTLGAALLSLFQVVTLEGWAEMQAVLLPARPWAWVYFASFIVVAVFVVINLFIAVVINNLETAKADEQRRAEAAVPTSDLAGRLARIRHELEAIESAMRNHAASANEDPACGRNEA